MLHPVRVLFINLFWLPSGTKLTKVVGVGLEQELHLDIEKVQKIAKAVRNIELLAEFGKKT